MVQESNGSLRRGWWMLVWRPRRPSSPSGEGIRITLMLWGLLLLIVAVLSLFAVGFGAFLYNRVLAAPDTRVSGPLRPTLEQQERSKVVQQRFASGSLRLWKRTWPTCLVVALIGVGLIAVGTAGH